MFIDALKQVRAAAILLACITLLTGVIYPAVVTGIAQLFFPVRANGSLIVKDNVVIGSRLIGQAFTDPKYFLSRPSATLPYAYNGGSSAGSNLGPLNPVLITAVTQRVADLKAANPDTQDLIPIDLVTTSASGLDPDISPAAAYYQSARIAKLRNVTREKIDALIEHYTHAPSLGFLGEYHVNVLEINLALDSLNKE